MKFTKRSFLLCLVILFSLTVMLTLASCSDEEGEHSHSYVSEIVAPTCTEKGYTKYVCSCGDSYTDNATPAAHTMVQVVQKEATCSEEGYSAYSECSVCGYKENNPTVFPKLAHEYITEYKYPTFAENGERTRVCRVCNHTEKETIEAVSAVLPSVSKVLGKAIGTLSATVEMTEGSQFVLVNDVTENDLPGGTKRAFVVDVAEAMISGDGEDLQGHLMLKIGTAETELTGLVSSKDAEVDMTDAEYVEFYLYVNGDTVSIEMNGETATKDLSDELYNAIAQMLGMESYEQMLESFAWTQGLGDLLPILEKLAETTVEGIPTISPDYMEKLDQVFESMGEDIIAETTDDNGNTVYSLNFEALNRLTENLEGKTVAAYLAEVFGEDVMGALTSFLTDLPDMTVRQIANAAVDFAEGTETSIDKIYMMIDLFIYNAYGEEFSIENEIVNRYDYTVAEILSEMSGVSAENTAEYVNNMKASMDDVAEALKTTTVEELLSLMFDLKGDNFFDEMAAILADMNEFVKLEITADAEGNLIGILSESGYGTYVLDMDGETVTLQAILTGGLSHTLIFSENGVEYSMSENNEIIGGGSLTVSETVEGENVTTVIEADLWDNDADYLDLSATLFNDELVELEAELREYVTRYDPDLGHDVNETRVLAVLSYEKDGYELGEELSDYLVFEFGDNSVTLIIADTRIDAVISSGGENTSRATLETSETTLTFSIYNDVDARVLYLALETNEAGDALIRAEFEVLKARATEPMPTPEDEGKVPEQISSSSSSSAVAETNEYVRYAYELIDNETGMDMIRLEANGMVFVLGYEEIENGVRLQMMDEDRAFVFAELNLTDDGEVSVADILLEGFGQTALDMSLSASFENDELTLSVDLDYMTLGYSEDYDKDIETGESVVIRTENVYCEFEGAIKLKLA